MKKPKPKPMPKKPDAEQNPMVEKRAVTMNKIAKRRARVLKGY